MMLTISTVKEHPVALVGYVVDGVLVGYVRAQVRAAVGDVVLVGAVQIGAGGKPLGEPSSASGIRKTQDRLCVW